MDFVRYINHTDRMLLRTARGVASIAVFLFALLAAENPAYAAIPVPPPPGVVTLAWDPSPSTNVTGYNIYYGTAPRTYSAALNAGFSTTCVITNLTRGVTYYFSATALDRNGMESDYSAELAYLVPVTVNPVLKLQRQPTGDMTITTTGIQGYQYTVLASENMTTWKNIATVTANSTGQIQWTDPASRNFKKRYYRLQQATP